MPLSANSSDECLGRAIAALLCASRQAHAYSKAVLLASRERDEIFSARARAGAAASAYCDRTGIDRARFDRALVDGDLVGESLLLSLVEIMGSVVVHFEETGVGDKLFADGVSIQRQANRLVQRWKAEQEEADEE